MVQKGIKHIRDIYDYRTKAFHKFEDLKELYNLPANEIFFYNQIRSYQKNGNKNLN